jgi:DNA mismatch repair protein MutS2
MLYPTNFEEKIGFDKIRTLLDQRCSSASGRAFVKAMGFSNDLPDVQRNGRQTEEFMQAIHASDNLPSITHPDSQHYLSTIHMAGSFLEGTQIWEIGMAVESVVQWLSFLHRSKDKYPELHRLAQSVQINAQIPQMIQDRLDERGEVKDSASRELQRIRRDLQRMHGQVRKSLERIIGQTTREGLTPDDTSLTVRNGRLVIPIKAEYKRSFRGFIHDESGSGNIVYIEPAEVLETNNALRDLEYQEKREVIKILVELTDLLRPEAAHLKDGFRLLGMLDFIRAKAMFSLQVKAILPKTEARQQVMWRKAIHPVLLLSLQKQGKSMVPQEYAIHDEQRIIIISGPNAGGKSVSLKTVALLQYMLQCGMPIPVAEDSVCGIFDRIFIEIGDEQSIENDLSTYSSHLRSMTHFLQHCNEKTLFLIDEFGSGTDPQFGGSIAEAILEKLVQCGARGIVTTHFGNLKKMGNTRSGIVNARMRFDIKNLEPLYQLEIGRQGSSFSLEIAGKIGLPAGVLDAARQKVGVDEVQLERLLGELEAEKKHYEEERRRFGQQAELLTKSQQHYQELKEKLEAERRQIIGKAKAEAGDLLWQANQKIENTIRAIKENKAEKESTRALRESLSSFRDEIAPKPTPQEKKPRVKVLKGAIQAGDKVRIKGQESIGDVLKVERTSAAVAFGVLKSKVALSRLEKVQSAPKPRQEDKAPKLGRAGINLTDRRAAFSSELDLRGKRADEALMALTAFLDDALMFAIPMVRIIHGKGDGILRELVRNELKEFKTVRSFSDEHADRGGPGVTVVDFQ